MIIVPNFALPMFTATNSSLKLEDHRTSLESPQDLKS